MERKSSLSECSHPTPSSVSPLSEEAIAELERLLADERLWPAPWVARSFEIDCPCPNGEHCGDSHSCEEVEAREAYPNGAPGNPAADGDGQCVVQISVPGLETFAKPTAAFIAAARNAFPALLAEVRAGREKLREMTARALGHAYACGMAESGEELVRGELEFERRNHAETLKELRATESQLSAALAQRDDAVKRAGALRVALFEALSKGKALEGAIAKVGDFGDGTRVGSAMDEWDECFYRLFPLARAALSAEGEKGEGSGHG